MPTVGFGTAGLAADTSKAVLEALSVGYKLIDTAQVSVLFACQLLANVVVNLEAW